MEYFGVSLWIIFFLVLGLDVVVAAVFGFIFKDWESFFGIATVGLIGVFVATMIAEIAISSHNTTAFNAGVVNKYNVLVVEGPSEIPTAGNTVKNVTIVKDRLYLNCNAIIGDTPLDTRLFCGTLEELAR